MAIEEVEQEGILLSRYDNRFEKGRGRGKSAARVCKASSVNAQFSARARSREVFLPRPSLLLHARKGGRRKMLSCDLLLLAPRAGRRPRKLGGSHPGSHPPGMGAI